jgi:hypothetical protein
MRGTQRATAGNRVGAVSLTVCTASICMYRWFRLHSSFCPSIMSPPRRKMIESLGKSQPRDSNDGPRSACGWPPPTAKGH